MPLRLVIRLPQRVLKTPLEIGEILIGSDPSCAVVVAHPTVSRRHAVLRMSNEGTTLEDLGSSNGTRVDGTGAVGQVAVSAGSRLSFGSVTGELEEVREGDLRPALSLAGDDSDWKAGDEAPSGASESETRGGDSSSESSSQGDQGEGHATLSSSALETFTLRHLPQFLESLRSMALPRELAHEVGAAVFSAFPCLEVRITLGRGDRREVWFEARSAHSPPGAATAVQRRDGDLEVSVSFFPPSLGQIYAPVVETILHLVGLGHRLEMSPDRFVHQAPPPLPAPPSVEANVQEIYRRAAQVGPGNVGVLIGGESGTGKEVLARYLHAASGRPKELFVALNCAALPRDLLELELFGIETAVATGVDARPGKFELAEGGTLFLDEIGDMALETQAKILRVLQEGEVYRLGGKQARPARPRILAATNKDFEAMVKSGAFRSDLFHRIAGWVVRLPPLRERSRDIPNLAAYFLGREAERRGERFGGVSRSAIDSLRSWHWPGNIRELEREMARASLFLGEGEILDQALLDHGHLGSTDSGAASLKVVLDRAERQEIEKALALTGGDTHAASRRLGVGRSTLYRRLKALGIQEPDP